MNLNVEIDDDFTDLMPPTRAQHEQRFGDTILGHAIGEESPKEAANNKKDEEPPKPTADVIMSRRLRGGVKGGFDFDFLSDENDSDDTKNNNQTNTNNQNAGVEGKNGLSNESDSSENAGENFNKKGSSHERENSGANKLVEAGANEQ